MADSAAPNEVPATDPTPPSISAAATAYQTAMGQQSAAPTSTESPIPAVPHNMTRDVEMTDGTPERVPSPAIAPGAANIAPSPMPARTATPRPSGHEVTSRAASQHPDPAPTIPKEAPPHGAPTRQYLNSKVTGVLLEGMKIVAKEQPNDPLRVLGEYLLQKSREAEGTAS